MARRLLCACCENGSLTLLKTTLAEYPQLLNEVDPSRGKYPLEISLAAEQFEAARYLRAQGADPNAANKVLLAFYLNAPIGTTDTPVLGLRE